MGNYILGPNGDFVAVDELYHYGIKGMKWGVRRYQNKDGSLTEAGKKRVREAGVYLFPAYDRKRHKYKDSTEHRNRKDRPEHTDGEWHSEVNRARRDEANRLLRERTTLQKAGYIFKKNIDPRSTEAEHNNDILTYLVSESPSVKAAVRKRTEKFLDIYADDTLADLSLRNTDSAKAYVIEHLKDSNYVRGLLNEPRVDRH